MRTRCVSLWIVGVVTLALTGALFLFVWHGGAQADSGPATGASSDDGGPAIPMDQPDAYKAASPSASQSGEWQIESVDFPEKLFDAMTDRSLRLDADGHPHVAYGESHLHYAWHDGTGWHYEIVDDAADVGLFASLALDGDGYAHISYFDSQDFNLKYAYRDPSGWHVETVQSEGYVGTDTSIAVDENGYPHISYQNLDTGVEYAYLDADGWHTELVDNTFFTRVYTSLALDGDGNPHISYFDADPDFDVRYAYLDASGWHTETVDSRGPGSTKASSLALDRDGRPHISYGGYQIGLAYAYLTASGWETETIDTVWAGSPSLALDSDGCPRVSYEDVDDHDLRSAYRDASGWHTQTVDSDGSVGAYTSLALNEDGYPHVSYKDRTNDNLKHAHWDGSAWHTEIVDTEFAGADGGEYTSLALDSQGYPHISCYNSTDEDLMYVYLDASGWVVTTVDSEGDVGKYTSLALDGDDHPHISYVDDPHNDLKYAYYDGAAWSSETVGDGWSGWHTSLALEATAPYRPHISYSYYGFMGSTEPYRRVSYARLDAGGWQISTVDDGGTTRLVGHGTSLALDEEGYPRISYESQDSAGNDRVRYTYWNESGRYTQNVDGRYSNQVPAFRDVSLALDGEGNPHISYYEALSTEDLNYAYWDGSGWSTTSVDTTGDVGQHSSLALDSSGNPHISYYDESNGALKYAHFDGTTWISETVDSAAPTYIDVGQYTSLALDDYDQPHISYYETGKLKYAHYVATPADLAIVKTVAPTTAAPGDTIVYTLVFTNTGSGTATGVVLDDDIPDSVINTSIVSSGADLAQRAGTRYTWDVVDLVPGAGGTITITGELGASPPTTFANTAFISSVTRDTNPENNSASALLTLEGETPQNTPPTISNIPNQSTDVGTPVVVSFTVFDAETPAGDLVVSAESSSTALVPGANIVLGGSGTERTATITPAAGATGVTIITITVSDGELSDDESFALAVGVDTQLYLPLVVKAYTSP